MQTTLESTLEIVVKAKAHLEASSARLLHLLSFVPDDKLDWLPSATSKSALRLITHIARSDQFFAKVIAETLPAVMPTVEEFFGRLHAEDPNIIAREKVVALLQESTAELLRSLSAVDAESLEAPRNSPVGVHPASFWIGIANEHRATHIAQLEYLQTIWGDLDNHFG